MSPRKALDQSLLQQLQCMRESPVGEHAHQNKERTRLDVAPGKSISNLDFVSSESESGSETESGPESEPEERDIEENDDADDEQQVISLSDISAEDFALVKYNQSVSQVPHRRMHGERQQWTNFAHISGIDLWIAVQVWRESSSKNCQYKYG